jgi:CheY-like chemotaxis protein
MTMRIALIDDSETNLAVLRRMTLKALAEPCECQTFNQSQDALAHLTSQGADLVIVDYSMPTLTGTEFIKRLRTSPLHASTPILMVTGSLEAAVRKRALEVGATEVLTKPVNAFVYQDTIRRMLGRNEVAVKPAA